MYKDLAVALAALDPGRGDRDDTVAARREIVRNRDHRGRARLRLANDTALTDGLAARLELRLHERDDVAAVAQLLERGRQGQTQRDKGNVRDDEVHTLIDRDALPRVHALVHDDAGILAEAPVQLTLSHVDRVDPERPALQQDIGEAPGRGADIDRDLPRDVKPQHVERARELVAATRDVPRAFLDGELRILGHGRSRPIDAAAIDTDHAGKDEGLGALAARSELTLHQKLVEAYAFCQCADSRAHSRYCAAMPASYARMAGLASLLGGVLVLLGIGIAGVATPNYDATRDVISASQLGPYGYLVTLALAAGGSLTVVFASLLQRTLPAGNPIGPTLLVVRGFGTLLAAAFVADFGPVRTASGLLHVVGFIGGSVAFGIALFFLAGRMLQDESWGRFAPYTVATSLASLALLGLFVGLGPRYVADTSAPLSSLGGLIQRSGTVIAWTWHIVIGTWLLVRPERSPVRS